ncbi:hypothetical protein BU25DRAFT_423345 [Macroventuria anomochaeta]|uniref:Uncharacterized protein n=1 Tax=Macroventuria anomochaeta TaxID=301207 RepID=A0ACB6RWI6_9PLEO|nr:uncharacterized protein BU25DRAFT_423345 [Macroventuria anomochaeta]KAF2625252.1 hypothetical protein BU25DRAFT_423345 [Macroventuria anomochaeta]
MKQYLTNTRVSKSAPDKTPSLITHGPSSRRLSKMRASEHSQASQASSSSSTSRFRLSRIGSQASSAIRLNSAEAYPPSPPLPIPQAISSHDYPTPIDKVYMKGVTFDVNFNHVYTKGECLQPSQLCYAVRHKSTLSGGRALSKCLKSDAKAIINGTSHILSHIRKKHSIDPSTGSHIPSTPVNLPLSFFTAAAHVPGSSKSTSHMPWEADQFQNSVVDWTIMRDLSFGDVTCPSTRGLLTWNRINLLYALPDLSTTLSNYTKKHYIKRKSEIYRLIQPAPG